MRFRLALALFLAPTLALVASPAGCTDDPATGTDASASDAGTLESSSFDVPGAKPVIQRGNIIVARQKSPVEGAVVSSSAGSKVTTDVNGAYSLIVPQGIPYTMTVEKQGFYKLIEQEWSIDKETVRVDTSFLTDILASILGAAIPDLDATKGLLTVNVNGLDGCNVDGATVTIEPAGAKLVYPRDGLPSKETTVKAGELPSAIFYNVPPGVPVKITAAHPTCKFVPYPTQADGFTYTGNVTTEPGKVLSFARVFIRGTGGPVSDAAAD